MIHRVQAVNLTRNIREDIFKGDSLVQLYVEDKQLFFDKLDTFAELISLNSSKIVSLRGPCTPSKGLTLFEDVVQIASKLEDYFDINLRYVTTSVKYGWKPIVELNEFYEGSIEIFVEDFGNPIDTVLQIAKANMNFKMSWDGLGLSGCWFEDEVLLSLAPFVGEIDLTELAPGAHLLAFLERQPEVFYVHLD